MMKKLKGRFEKKNGVLWFRMARPVIRGPYRRKNEKGEGEVIYPTGYGYNGGTVVNGQWVKGYLIDPPRLPKGFRLRSLGVGLQLNAIPPIQTMYLERIQDADAETK